MSDLTAAAEWLASTGYPIEFTPDLPPPPALWAALVDVIHADPTGAWHGNELSREEVDDWLRDEAGLTTTTTAPPERPAETDHCGQALREALPQSFEESA